MPSASRAAVLWHLQGRWILSTLEELGGDGTALQWQCMVAAWSTNAAFLSGVQQCSCSQLELSVKSPGLQIEAHRRSVHPAGLQELL